jgi:hypothetical protein
LREAGEFVNGEGAPEFIDGQFLSRFAGEEIAWCGSVETGLDVEFSWREAES